MAPDGRKRTGKREPGASPGGDDPVVSEEDVAMAQLEAHLQGDSGSRVPPPAAPPPLSRRDPLDDFFYAAGEAGTHIPALALPAIPERATAREVALREYLAFFLGDEEYALEIERVREIVKPPPITEVPRAPSEVVGVITLRGEVVPVFEIRARIGLPVTPLGPKGRIVLCDAGEGTCGILVDAVSHVVRLPPQAIEERPQGVGGVGAEYLVGIGRQRDRMLILLDLPAVLAP